MLLNDLYTIEPEPEKDSGRIQIKLNPEHAIFKGHFPGQPVLPGVCMVEMIREILAGRLGLQLRIIKSPMIKFLSMIIPENHPAFFIEMKYEEQEGMILAEGKIFYEQTVFMKYSLELKPF